MRRIVTALLMLALAAGLAAVTAREATPATRATIRVARQQPLVLLGAGFKSRELVRVSVTAGDKRGAHRVRAGSSGGFRASFDEVYYDPCGDVLLVRAAGSKGSVASLKVPQHECPNLAAQR